MKRAIYPLFVLLLMLSCNKENAPDFLTRFGETLTEKRNLENFLTIDVRDEFDVELIQDSANFIEVTYSKNLLDKVESRVVDRVLILENKNSFNWVRKLGKRIEVKLHCTKIDLLKLDGDGTIFNRDTFFGDTLDIKHSGTRDINLILKSEWATFRCSNIGGLILKGSCGILSGTVEQTAIFDGRDFLASDGYFFHFSLSNSFIRAEQLYGLNLFGKGNLFYMQEPLRKLDKKEVGSGKVLKF